MRGCECKWRRIRKGKARFVAKERDGCGGGYVSVYFYGVSEGG